MMPCGCHRPVKRLVLAAGIDALEKLGRTYAAGRLLEKLVKIPWE
jgi:hypothetical protein